MNYHRIQANFLRVIAIVQMLTFGLVVVPTGWLAEWHAWLGFGAMPDDAFLRYVIRGASFAQGAVGIWLWAIATDVVKFRLLVIVTGIIYFVAGPAFLVIDATVGLPGWWCAMDSVSCLVVGGIVLALCWLSRA